MAAPEPLHDHWWWRPGWAPGRRMLTFHLTFSDSAALCATARSYRSALQSFEVFDEVPDRWLHLTVQDVAFLDAVTARQIDEVSDAAADALAALTSFNVTFLPAQVGTEGVFVTVEPCSALDSLRDHLRGAIAESGLPVPGEATGFWPHVSVAYCHRSAPSEPVNEAVARVASRSVTVPITRVDLIALSRDEHVYEWLPIAAIPLR